MEVLDASFVAAATRQAALPPPAFAEIAFAGRSNVGKSSLINKLVGLRKLVRSSSSPGATRELALKLDRTERVGLRAVVVIIDIRRGPEDDDVQLLEFLAHVGVPAILVATKLDKLPANKRKPEIAKLKRQLGQKPVGFSAASGDGVDALWKRILYAASILGEDQREA